MSIRSTYLVISAVSLVAACSTALTAPPTGGFVDYTAWTCDGDPAHELLSDAARTEQARVASNDVRWRDERLALAPSTGVAHFAKR